MIHKHKLGFYNKIGVTFNIYFHSNIGEAGIEIKRNNFYFPERKIKFI